jgi:magnesium transporter
MKQLRKRRSKKAGLPPGSLVHIGEVKTPRPSLSVVDFGPEGYCEADLADAGALRDYRRQHRVLWANLYGVHEPAILGEIGRIFGLHPLVVEDILNTDQRQKIDGYGGYLYLVLHRYTLGSNGQDLAQDQISLVIGKDFVLTFQEGRSGTFDSVKELLRSDRGEIRAGGADTLAYSLLDSIVDSYFGVVEALGDRADSLEEQVLAQPEPAALQGIHELKRCLSRLRRNLYPLREVLGTLYRDVGDYFRPEVQLYLRDVYDHTVHILESIEDLRDQATGLLDVYLSTVSHRVNLEVRTLTVIATVFMPATLIAGIFGMNFKLMPWLESPSGFDYALGLMAAVASTMLLLFWRRRKA